MASWDLFFNQPEIQIRDKHIIKLFKLHQGNLSVKDYIKEIDFIVLTCAIENYPLSSTDLKRLALISGIRNQELASKALQQHMDLNHLLTELEDDDSHDELKLNSNDVEKELSNTQTMYYPDGDVVKMDWGDQCCQTKTDKDTCFKTEMQCDSGDSFRENLLEEITMPVEKAQGCVNKNDMEPPYLANVKKDTGLRKISDSVPIQTNKLNKKHKCSECDFSTHKAHNLKQHLLKHTREKSSEFEKPYECHLCKSRFTELRYLQRHQRKRHDIYLR